MKHIKLFEQFEDIDDPFGEESGNEDTIKVGDKVKCINDYMTHLLKHDKIYTIRRVDFDGDVELVDLEDCFWMVSRFEKIK